MGELGQMTAFAAPGGIALALLMFAAVVALRRRPASRIQLLVTQGRFGEAGELALGHGLVERALDCFMQGEHHERAARCAVRAGRTRLAATLFERAGDAKSAALMYERVGMEQAAHAVRPDATVAAIRTIVRSAQLGASSQQAQARGDDAPPVSRPFIVRDPSPVCLDVLKRVKSLEAPPVATGRVLRLLDDPEADPKSVARELERDQQLATMVLRAANSAYYGAVGKVKDVTGALVLVGFDVMKQLVVGSLSLQSLGKKSDRIQRVLWKHALATAVAAQAVARASKGISPGHAFTVGLLHDIGKGILYQAFPGEYAAVWTLAETDPRSTHEIEAERFGTDHAEVGAEVLRNWKLPAIYAIATLTHHLPADQVALPPEEARLRSAIILASAIASWLGHGRLPRRAIEEFADLPSMAELGVSRDAVIEIAAAVDQDLAGYEGIFG
jgi:putative nucleotidyltransferase with HDIG domain